MSSIENIEERLVELENFLGVAMEDDLFVYHERMINGLRDTMQTIRRDFDSHRDAVATGAARQENRMNGVDSCTRAVRMRTAENSAKLNTLSRTVEALERALLPREVDPRATPEEHLMELWRTEIGQLKDRLRKLENRQNPNTYDGGSRLFERPLDLSPESLEEIEINFGPDEVVKEDQSYDDGVALQSAAHPWPQRQFEYFMLSLEPTMPFVSELNKYGAEGWVLCGFYDSRRTPNVNLAILCREKRDD